MASNIFDTRNIIKQTPKMGNRFLLAADSTQLNDIINGKAAVTGQGATSSKPAVPESKIRKLSRLTGGEDSVFGIPNVAASGSTAAVTGKSAYDVLNLSLLSATIPAFEFEAAELNRFNDTVKHITKFSTSNDMSAVYYDYINGSATSIMLAWQSKVGFKLTGEIGYKSQYVCDMNLYVYGPNRPGYLVKDNNTTDDSEEYELLMQFKIFNAWPRSVDIGEFSYDNTEIKKVTVQFSYDIIIPVMIKGEELAGPGLGLKNFTAATEINGTTASNVTSGSIGGKTITDDILYDIKL